MNLRDYEGEQVRIIDTSGREFIGKIGEYIYPDDNEPEVEAVILYNRKRYSNPIQFNAPDIKSIEILE